MGSIIKDEKLVPNRHLVLYVLFLLGGDTKQIYTEDIALKCHELFPQSFSWVRYPQFPDKETVRLGLTDARKEQYGALVEGRSGQNRGLTAKTKRQPALDGWRFTASGIQWINENHERLEIFVDSGKLKEHRQKVLRQLKRIKNHRVYAQFLDSPDRFYPMIGDVADILRCRVDAEEEIWQQRFDTVQRQADSSGQSEVFRFISLCKEAYLKQR